MNSLQILENKAAKVILDDPLLIRQPYCHHNKCRIFAFQGGRNIVNVYGNSPQALEVDEQQIHEENNKLKRGPFVGGG